MQFLRRMLVPLSATCIENQHVFLTTCKDLGVGGWGPVIPYGVRILNPLEIIGQPLTLFKFCHEL